MTFEVISIQGSVKHHSNIKDVKASGPRMEM